MTDHIADGVPLSEADAASPDAPHRIVVAFRDDHTIDGAKFDIIGVTPEQMIITAHYLTRTANQIEDARMMRAMQDRAEVQSVAEALKSGAKGLANLTGGRNGRRQ